MADARVCVGGRYRLDRKLASGGMGAVWQGWDERLQRPVAVKQLHLQPWLNQADRAVEVERILREARIAARLHHPNAVQVYDVVDGGDSPCLVMEYVPSRSLQEMVRDGRPLPPKEVARIGTQVAAALAAAHRAGIVHRDVKPGNVLVTEEGAAKITDFGIAHAFDDVSITATGMLTGTPAYLAPEVARGGRSDFASDVYALGATLYMAAEGRPPFGSDDNPIATLHRVASGQWQPPVRSGPLTPMLVSMMSADAAARPRMVDVASTLPDLHPLTPEPVSDGSSATTQVIAGDPAPMRDADTRVLAVPAPVAPPRAAPGAPPPSVRGLAPRRNAVPSWLPIVAALVVVALGAVLAVVLLGGSGGSSGGPAAVGPSGHATSHAHATSGSHRASPSNAGAPAVNQGHGGRPDAADLVNAVTHYFSVVPGNLDAGWQLLTPHFQRSKAQDRQTYDAFWNTVRRVDVRDVVADPPHDATATLTYHYRDGRVVTQRTVFHFQRQAGQLLIDKES